MDSFKIIRLVSNITRRSVVVDLKQSHHFCLQNRLLNSTRSFTSSENQPNVTASYLINYCGLSPEEASLASKKFNLRSPEKAHSVLALLRNHGFSQTQLSKVVRGKLRILCADAEKTLLPKLEFFTSCGMSSEDLCKMLVFDPAIFERSLEKRIIPSYNFLRSCLHSDKNAITVLKRNSWILRKDPSKNVVPNLRILRELGMPESVISLFILNFKEVNLNHDKLVQVAREVKEMGFDMKNTTSLVAICALCHKSIMNQSRLAYMKWGWSEDDIRSAFMKDPRCMLVSEKKITKVMDFLVNKMGWPARMVATDPFILGYSFEKRIMPRFSVVQVLLLKGSIKKDDFSFLSVVSIPEKRFLKKFVTEFVQEVPQLLNVYQGKVDVQDA